MANPQRPPPFPSANTPRVWLLTSAASAIGLTLARALLSHGDKLILGVQRHHLNELTGEPANDDLLQFEEEAKAQGWTEKFKVVELDGRVIAQCHAAVAEAIKHYHGLDILFCCASETVVGTVEELGTGERSRMLVKEQMETNFFGPTNVIKAALPAMREKKNGHILVLTGITSHLGTPGLGLYCAAGWALEGLCDSLAYEIAPYNIKMTIVQPNIEISVLPNKISAPPQLSQYANPGHPAPLQRAILGRIFDRLGVTASAATQSRLQLPKPKSSDSTHPPSSSDSTTAPTEKRPKNRPPPLDSAPSSPVIFDPIPSLTSSEYVSLSPSLSPRLLKPLLAETIYAICAIGGHENPPARHIVGNEAVSSVKEKLKTVSEELEDFIECSCGVDIEERGFVKTEKEIKKEDTEREVGQSTSQTSLVSARSNSGAEEIPSKPAGRRVSVASPVTVGGRKPSEGSIAGSSAIGRRESAGTSSVIDEMDVDNKTGDSRDRKRKGKSGKKKT